MKQLHKDIAQARYAAIVAQSKIERDAALADLRTLRDIMRARLLMQRDSLSFHLSAVE